MTQRKAYTSKDKLWTDHSGLPIPYNRTNAMERLQERHAATLLAEARRLEQQISTMKERVAKLHGEVVQAHERTNKVSLANAKGNMLWYNFDRSIRVEAKVNYIIKFDDITIAAAREKLNQYLANAINGAQELPLEFITDAFETNKGQLDPKRVLNLLTWRGRIKAGTFQEALDLIEKSIRRVRGKVYFSIGEQEEDGSYSNVNLNFSAA